MDFDLKDLEANRRGELTEHQKQEFERVRDPLFKVGWGAAFLVMGVGALAYHSNNFGHVFYLGILLCPGALVMITVLGFQIELYFILRYCPVVSVRGKAEIRPKTYRSTTCVVVPPKEFAIRSEVAEAFRKGKTYTLYYIQGTSYLVSAETHDDERSS